MLSAVLQQLIRHAGLPGSRRGAGRLGQRLAQASERRDQAIDPGDRQDAKDGDGRDHQPQLTAFGNGLLARQDGG